jgi:CRP-like cAMP-binding protein
MSEDNQKYVELIRQLIPIGDLSPQGQAEIINSGKILSVKKKGTLFEQGARDNFSFYLLEGEIELHANKQPQNSITSGSDRALYAMAQLQPRQFSAKAKIDSVVFQIQRAALDRLMVLQENDDTDSDSGMEVTSSDLSADDLDDDEDVDWMTRMLQSELYSRMPPANIGKLFALLVEVPFKTGDNVIQQGDPGDKYYIIQEGKCNVMRTPPSGGKDMKLATLGAGDSFGEEALVSESIRNATITMATDGILMELSKENFIELIKKPTLQSVDFETAIGMVDAGAVWLDVRFTKEHDSYAIANSLHIPLNMLRMQVDKLDEGKKYVVYCDTGGRSSTGAFLLAERGFEVCFLEGGIVNNPDAADKSEVTQVPRPPVQKAPPPPVKEVSPPPAEKKEEPVEERDVVDEISKQNLDPDVKASVLEAELSRTNMQLEEVEKAKQKADISIKEAQVKVEEELKAERAKIEQAKKEAEEESRKLRAKEEEKVEQMKVEAEKRMQEEKQKLEEVYSRNAEEMEKIEKMKQEAEALVQEERKRLADAAEVAKKQMEEAEALKKEMEQMREQQVLEASKAMEEAQRMKAEVEASRVAMEAAAEEKRKEQETMEQQIQQAAKVKLEAERRKFSEEFARNNEELENARREKAEAEAARQRAKDEADKIIAEYKMTHDKSHAEQEAILKAERMKLKE